MKSPHESTACDLLETSLDVKFNSEEFSNFFDAFNAPLPDPEDLLAELYNESSKAA